MLKLKEAHVFTSVKWGIENCTEQLPEITMLQAVTLCIQNFKLMQLNTVAGIAF